MGRVCTDFPRFAKGTAKRGWLRFFARLAAFALPVLARAADIASGAENWTIEPGGIPHIVYKNNRGVNFAVDKYGANGWEVTVHHARGWGYVEIGTVGMVVNSATFLSDLYTVEGSGDVFRFAFYWWPPQDSGMTIRHYGWVTLGTDNGELVILAAEVAYEPNAAIVGRGEPELDDPGGGDSGESSETGGGDSGESSESGGGEEQEKELVFDWAVIDCGDYLELGKQPRPSGGSGTVTIPDAIDGKPVCSIGEGAFYGHYEITRVVIPETVSNIGYKAFCCCTTLESCNIPPGVTNIGEWAFFQCALREIALPDGIKEIKDWTFHYCEYLSNATWGAGVTNIGEWAFCVTALTNVTIGCRVDCIGYAAFMDCHNLESVNVWPWTRLGEPSFDSSCRLGYTGTVTNFTGFARDCGEEDVTNLMTWVGRENFDGVTEFKIYDECGPLYGYEYGTSKMLRYAGLAPGVAGRRGEVLEAKYTNPKIEIASFDVAARKLTGKLVPQGGCRIAARPEDPWLFGILYCESPNSAGDRNWNAVPDLDKFLDADTLGEFTHTIPEEDFAAYRFYKLELSN